MNENTLIKIVIGFLVLLALGIYLNQKYEWLGHQPANYEYVNGKQAFTVTRVNEGNYLGYQITVFLNDNPYYLSIRNDPRDLESIPITGSPQKTMSYAKRVFITLSPEDNLTSKATIAALEIDKIIDNPYFYNLPVNSSMTSPFGNFPVISCSNATEDNAVIWLKKGASTQITETNNCIIVEGEDEDDLIKAADRLSLFLVGIMQR